MTEPPDDAAGALAIREAVLGNPIFADKLSSQDGTAAALYVPIVSKDESHRISEQIEAVLQRELDGQRYHIAGLPVAEDTFGVEMFFQMGIMAPVAMGVIFVLLLLMFKHVGLVLPPMVIALLSVVWVMGAPVSNPSYGI